MFSNCTLSNNGRCENIQQMPAIQEAPQIQSSAQDTLTESGGNNREELLPLAPQQND